MLIYATALVAIRDSTLHEDRLELELSELKKGKYWKEPVRSEKYLDKDSFLK